MIPPSWNNYKWLKTAAPMASPPQLFRCVSCYCIAFCAATHAKKPNIGCHTVAKVLFILPNNPGDVLMGLAVVDAWYRTHPRDILEYIVDQECRILVEGHPFLHRVHILPRQELQAMEKSGHSLSDALVKLEQFLENLGEFDLALNLFQGDIGAYLLYLIKAKEKRGKYFDNLESRMVLRDSWSRYLFAIPAARKNNPLHAVDVYLRMGGVDNSPPPRITLPPLPPLPLTPHKPMQQSPFPPRRIALQVGSAWPGKTWSTSRWTEFLQGLREFSKAEIHFLGAPEEIHLCEILASHCPLPSKVWAGRTNLLQVGTLLSAMDVLISGDTFAMHMAAAVGCPQVALFGSSNPVETGPYCSGATVLLSPSPRSLCFDFTGGVDCMDALQPAWVLDILRQKTPVPECTLVTAYYAQESRLSLESRGSLPPPCPKRAVTIPEEADIDLLPHKLDSLWQAQILDLQKFIANGDSAIAKSIERREGEINQLYPDSLTLEMYRMELNSLSLRPLTRYLQDRLTCTRRFHAIFATKGVSHES